MRPSAALVVVGAVVFIAGIAAALGYVPGLSVAQPCQSLSGCTSQPSLLAEPLGVSAVGTYANVTVSGSGYLLAGSASVSLSAAGAIVASVSAPLKASTVAGDSSFAVAIPYRFAGPGTYEMFAVVSASTLGTPAKTLTAQTPYLNLTVSGSSGSLTPSFTYAAGANPLQVCFTDTSSPAALVTGTAWTFGDGTAGSGSPACHLYTQAGSYVVTMNATTGTTMATLSRTVSVSAPPQTLQVEPNFGWVAKGLTLTFTDATAVENGSEVSVAWAFGDGGYGVGSPATHAYPAYGSYSVTESVLARATGSQVSRSFSVTLAVDVPSPTCSSCGHNGTSNTTTAPAIPALDLGVGLLLGLGLGLMVAGLPFPVVVRVAGPLVLVAAFAGWGVLAGGLKPF